MFTIKAFNIVIPIKKYLYILPIARVSAGKNVFIDNDNPVPPEYGMSACVCGGKRTPQKPPE